MREHLWLTNLAQRLTGLARQNEVRRRRSPTSTKVSQIETLESRQLLSTGSVVPVGIETQVNTYLTNNQRVPSTAMDAKGDYVVTWSGQSEDTSGYGIFAQRYNAVGAVQGNEFRVNSYTTGDQRAASVAMNASGAFVIVWSSDGQDGSGTGVYAQRYNAAGVAQGTELQVNIYTTGAQNLPTVAMDTAGDFVVTWQSNGQDGSGYGVYARRYSSTGSASAGEFLVNTGTTNNQGHSTIAMEPTGEFAIVWLQYSTTPYNYIIDMRRYSSAGVAVSGPVAVGGSAAATLGRAFNETPGVAIDPNGDLVVSWSAYSYLGVDNHGYGIYAQRFNAQNVPQGNLFLVNSYLTGAQFNPAVAMDSLGNFVITWTSNIQDGDQFGVYGQGYNSAGVRQGTEFRVNTFTKYGEQNSTVAIDSKGDFVVAWGGYQDGVAEDIYLQRYMLHAVPPDHAPVGTPHTVTTLEDKPYVFAAADFGFTDPNDLPANMLLSVKIATLPSVGSLTINSVAVAKGSTLLASDIVAGKLKFTPAANKNGSAYASFTFQVIDNGDLTNGGVNIDPTPRNLTVAVTSVNDPPVGTAKTVTAFEDQPYVFTTADFGFTDPTDVPANGFLSVKITTLPFVGSLTNNGAAVLAGSSVLASDISAGKLKFTPVANKNGVAYASLTFQVKDDGSVQNGGIDVDATPRKLTISVTPVNDPPVGVAKVVTTLEDKAYVFKATDFPLTDPIDVPANTFYAVKVTTLPTVGSLTNNGIAITAGSSVLASDIAAGKFQFTPAANKSGAAYTSFTFQVRDNGGIQHGGNDTDLIPRKMSVSVTAVNDAPVGTATTVTVSKNASFTFAVANFGFTDPNDSPANTLLAVTITALPASGILKLNGIAVQAGASISAADLVVGRLKYTPPANAKGTPLTTFMFKVADNGGTTNGGINLDTTARTLTINVV